jgi:cell division protease FtsH
VLKAQEVAVLLLQLGIVVVVMRFLRPGIQLPGSETRASTAFVSVPYSDFLSKINSDQVLKVEVDGVHIMFKLKSDLESGEVASSGSGSILQQQEAEALVKSVAPTKRIVYTTTRPSDIRTPYEKMLENEVEFGSPDRRSGGLFHPALVSNLLLLEYIRI